MSKIRTYKDLLAEEQRLQQVLKRQEIVIREDLISLKENIEPVRKVYDQVHKIFTRDNRVPLFNVGLEMSIDLLLRRFVLRRAGWFVKTFIPYVVKNYASHIIGEEKRKAIIRKIEELFNKIRSPKAKHTQASSFE